MGIKYIIKTTSYDLTQDEVLLIYDKMSAIKSNLESIENYSRSAIKHTLNADNVESIGVDMFSAIDEFEIKGTFDNGIEGDYDKNFLLIEVVTEETAIANDKDFLKEEERGHYELGKTYSYYTKLGFSEYWYRLM